MKGTFCPSQEKIPRGESRGRQGQELVTGSDKSQLLSQGRRPTMGFVDHLSVNRWGMKDNPGPDTGGSCSIAEVTQQLPSKSRARTLETIPAKAAGVEPWNLNLTLSLRGHV